MKRVLLSVLVVCLLAGQASADLFTLNHDAAMMLWEVSKEPDSTRSFLDLVTDNLDDYGTVTMRGEVGYVGSLGGVRNEFSWMRIGANGATADVIGAALGTDPTSDLSGYAGYSLYLANDNDDLWQVRLYVETSADGSRETKWVTLATGSDAVLTLDFAGLDLTEVTDIGFDIGGLLSGSGGNPSNPDWFHVSAVPTPVAVLLGMLGLGVAGLKLRKFV